MSMILNIKMTLIKKIIPLILPQKCFTDKFDSQNAYNDMNPSMIIDSEGSVTILVRRVSYKMFQNKKYTNYAHQSHSIYVKIKTCVDDWYNLTCDDIMIDCDMPTYPTFWAGIEDIRFISENSMILICPTLNEKGNPSIVKCLLRDNILHSFEHCFPNKIEKNWMPYTTHQGTFVIYSLSPFCIKPLLTDERKLIMIPGNIQSELDGYHGSTNGVIWQDGSFLFMIHINTDKVYHRWLTFNPQTIEVCISKPFTFFKHSFIEFPCSLVLFKERLFISLGVNDNNAFVIEVDSQHIKTCLKE